MGKHFFDKTLAHLSIDSQSFNHHIDYWNSVLEDYPKNRDLIYMAMNSKLFDWKNNAVFSDNFDINPLTYAIEKSPHLIDIIYYKKDYAEAENEARQALTPLTLQYLMTRKYEDLKFLHPFLLNVVYEPHQFSMVFKNFITEPFKQIKKTKYSLNFITNIIKLYFNDIFFMPEMSAMFKIDGTDFWKIIALGVDVPIDLLEDSCMNKNFILNDEYNDFKKVIKVFSETGEITPNLKNEVKDKDGLEKISNYLAKIKNRTSLLLLLYLN
jgi:hypothetical protein